MSDTEIPRLYLDSAADIAQLAPYLIGFTPDESLVIVVMEDSQVQVTARADLADMLPPGAAEDLLDRIWARFPNTDAFLIAYTRDADAGWALLDRCADHLPDGVLRQNMLVDQDTWHLPDGTHGRLDPSGRVSAEAATHGMKLLGDRAELEARFASAPDSPKLDAAVRAALDDQPRYRTLTALLDHTRELLHRNLVSRAPFDRRHAIEAGQRRRRRAADSARAEPARARLRARLHHQSHRTAASGVVERGPEPHTLPFRRGAGGDRRDRGLGQRRRRRRQHRPHPLTSHDHRPETIRTRRHARRDPRPGAPTIGLALGTGPDSGTRRPTRPPRADLTHPDRPDTTGAGSFQLHDSTSRRTTVAEHRPHPLAGPRAGWGRCTCPA